MTAIKRTRAKQRTERRRQQRRATWRRLIRWASFAVVFASASVLAAPANITESSGSVASIEAPAGTEISAGDGKVSGQTGSFGYTIPIAVPPGRLGAEPSIALSYSSQAPLYGGVAAGWSLSLPTIARDFSEGPKTPFRWISSLTGRELLAVDEPTPGGTVAYRSKSDPSYARYQRTVSNGNWTVLFTDGSALFFEELFQATNASRTHFHLARSSDKFGNEVHYTWNRLDPSVLAHEARLLQVDYTINSAVNGGASHAHVEFSYGPPSECATGVAAVGSKVSYRSGERRITGREPLVSITTRVADPVVGFRTVRRYDFAYDADAASCDPVKRFADSPIRLLTSVTENAWSPDGTLSSLPPITFSYGAANSPFLSTGPVAGATALLTSEAITTSVATAAAAFTSLPLLPAGPRAVHPIAKTLGDVPQTLLRDMDGDGILDLLYSAEPSAAVRAVDSRCYIGWKKGLGLDLADPTVAGSPLTAFFGAETLVPMPTVPWKNWGGDGMSVSDHPRLPTDLGTRDTSSASSEACTVVGQHTMDAASNTNYAVHPAYLGAIVIYSFEDIDGDGLADLAVGMEIDGKYYSPLDKGLFTCTGSVTTASNAEVNHMQQCVSAGFSENECRACLEEAAENGGAHSCNAPHWEAPPAPEIDPWPNPGGPLPDPGAPEAADTLASVGTCDGPGDNDWNVYINDGTGRFGLNGNTGNESASFSSEAPVSKAAGARTRWEGIDDATGGLPRSVADLDGDGRPDIAALDNFRDNQQGTDWTLNRHHLDLDLGYLQTDSQHWAEQGIGGEGSLPLHPGYATRIETPTLYSRTERRRLIDIHGDGIADYLDGHSETLFIRPGRGYGDAFSSAFLAPVRAAEPFDVVSVIELALESPTVFERREVRGFVDLDSDGRLDYFDAATPQIFYNVGDGFIAGTSQFLKQQRTGNTTAGWAILRDWIDLDGDGLTEFIEVDDDGEPSVYKRALASHGARRGILHHVDNGRGLTLDVKYAPHTDAATVTMGTAKLPSPTWVVSAMTATHAHGGAAVSTTNYHYTEPVWSQDENERWGFRGFEGVVMTGPSGATSEERYDYAIDWSGRQVATLAYAQGSANPNRFSETVWSAFQALGVTSFHATQTTEYVCELESAGVVSTLAEVDCKAQTTPLTNRSLFAALVGPVASNPSFGQQIAYVSSAELSGELDASGSQFVTARCSSSSTNHVYTDDEYRVATTTQTNSAGPMSAPPAGQTISSSACSGAAVVGLSQTTYDPTLKAPLYSCFIRSASETATPGSGVCARVDVDLSTGLTSRAQSPQGFDDDTDLGQEWVTGVATTTYDNLGLFPIQVENALGHTVTMSTDLGTGVQLSSYGPNPNQGGYQEIDGFGRTLHEWVSIKDDPDPNQPYHYRRKRDVTYNDAGNPATVIERPTRLLSNEGTLQNNSNAYWADITTTYDGQGRVIKVYEATLAGAGQDASTRTYLYDASGNLVSITTPDPVKQRYQLGDVVYTFGYDSLGRKTCSLGPDGSGIATIYAGRRVTTVEFGSDGGDCQSPTDPGITTPRSAGLAEADVFGRVIRVEERVDANADIWSTTLYEYDGNSNLVTITREDPTHGDIVTEMTHDFAGNRTQIDRHGRSWSYTYDRNGNLLTQRSPVPILVADPNDFTVSTLYDQLNRPIARLNPVGSLDATEQANLGVGETTYEYDQGLYGLGQLTRTVSPVATVDYTYDARGNPWKTTRNVDLSDTFGANIPLVDSLTLTNVSWNAFNQPATVVHPSGRKTFTFYHRWPSVPRHVYVYQDDGKNEFYLSMRNAAGVAKRLIHLKRDGATTVYGRHVFYGHDQVGRLTQEYSTDVGDDKISQIASYYGTSEVATLQTQVGPVADTRNFVYFPTMTSTS